MECSQKAKHETKRIALKAAERVSEKKGVFVRAYKCECGFFHLTSKRYWREESIFPPREYVEKEY